MANITNIISSKKAYMNYFKNLKQMSQVFGLFIFLISAIGITSCGTVDNTGTPNADAGDTQEVLTGEETILDGQASTGVENAAWSFSSRPDGSAAVLGHSASLTPTFTPDVAGDYVVELSINGGASTDTVTITASEVQAVVSVPAGSAVTTRTRFNVTEYVIDAEEAGGVLSAATSRASVLGNLTLPKNTKAATVAGYLWEQVEGPSATTTNGSTSTTLEFTAPTLVDMYTDSDHYKWQVFPISRNDTKMVFKLTVTGSNGGTDTTFFTIYLTDGGSEIHTASGLPSVAVGSTVYLAGPDLKASTANTTTQLEGGAITDWSWALTVPDGSAATFVDSGTTSSTLQNPKFVPDVVGTYTVSYSSVTGAYAGATAATTVKSPGTLTINAADWVGVGIVGGTTAASPQCAACHDGSVETDRQTGWLDTIHASVFENNMTAYAALSPEPYLWQIHTVGYNTDADNSGFDDLVSANAFVFPPDGLTFAQFAANNAAIAKLANVQCENCHGPGSRHEGDANNISHSFAQTGVCAQCHIQEDEWKNSAHNSTGVVHGSGNYQNSWVSSTGCVRCHNAKGFEAYLEEGEEGLADMRSDTGSFPGITCAACHDPHEATNSHQLRLEGDITMIADGLTVDAGKAAVCYTCHDGNYSHGEYDCDANGDGVTGSANPGNSTCDSIDETALGYWRGGYHYTPQGPVLEANEALTDLNGDGTDDFELSANAGHGSALFTIAAATGDATLSTENNKCITCHMATGPEADEPGYQHLGGHAWKLRTDHGLGHLTGGENPDDTTEAAGEVMLTSACSPCHESLTDFNRTSLADYDGDGVIEGVQDEVKGLFLNLTTLLKSLDTSNIKQVAAGGTSQGTTESAGVISVDTLAYAGTKSSGLTTAASCSAGAPSGGRNAYQQCNFLDASDTLKRAMWNYNMLVRDGSLGIHNFGYTVQVLQGTYKALQIILGGQASTYTYQTAFPNATLR